jgi:hypothetical protein
MSETKYVYLTGKAKWPRLSTPDKEYNNYSISISLDKKSRKTFDDSMLRLEPKSFDDGDYIKVRCGAEKLINGELVKFGPPKVIDSAGNTFDPMHIGNGSTVTVKLAVYDTKKGKGHRLTAVRVDKLVPYDRPISDDRPF